MPARLRSRGTGLQVVVPHGGHRAQADGGFLVDAGQVAHTVLTSLVVTIR